MRSLPVDYVNPSALADPGDAPFSHVSVATGTTYYRFCGQVPIDPAGATVSSEMGPQLRRCYEAVSACLDAVGLSWGDVTHVFTFTTDIESYAQVEADVAKEFYRDGSPPATAIGVARLEEADWLVEVQVDAIR